MYAWIFLCVSYVYIQNPKYIRTCVYIQQYTPVYIHMYTHGSFLLWVLCHFTGFARLVWGRSKRDQYTRANKIRDTHICMDFSVRVIYVCIDLFVCAMHTCIGLFVSVIYVCIGLFVWVILIFIGLFVCLLVIRLLYACVYMSVCLCVKGLIFEECGLIMCVSIRLCVVVSVWSSVCMSVFICVCMYLYVCVLCLCCVVSACLCLCVCLFVCVCMSACLCVCMSV